MTLDKLINAIEDGVPFLYKGEVQRVVWHERNEELVWIDAKGNECIAKNFAVYFEPARVTLRSMYPIPRFVDRPDYEL